MWCARGAHGTGRRPVIHSRPNVAVSRVAARGQCMCDDADNGEGGRLGVHWKVVPSVTLQPPSVTLQPPSVTPQPPSRAVHVCAPLMRWPLDGPLVFFLQFNSVCLAGARHGLCPGLSNAPPPPALLDCRAVTPLRHRAGGALGVGGGGAVSTTPPTQV